MVNDTDLSNLTHSEAVSALCASVNEVKLIIQHDPLPDGWLEFNLEVSENEPLGVVLGGGVEGTHANPFDFYDEGIFVTKNKVLHFAVLASFMSGGLTFCGLSVKDVANLKISFLPCNSVR
ncbi:protein lap4 [Trichonephila clavipes]|nr:protein lap4 [Trichonephila clavipes]